jgi:hypothetical protein
MVGTFCLKTVSNTVRGIYSLLRTLFVITLTLECAYAALAQQPEPLVTLHRTACYGTCPVYSLEIFADGFIRCIGINFVQYTGEHRAVVAQETVENLVADFLRADYFALHDSYETYKDRKGRTWTITDLPTVITSLRVGTTKKSVRDYASAPRRLRELEEEIDRVANTRRWIGNPPPNGPIPALQAPLPTTLKPPAS